MKQNKTQKTNESITLFLSSVRDEQKRKDSYTLLKLMEKITQARPYLWGTSIIGFGEYHYKYKTGREGDWFLTGFSPRKQALALYLMCDLLHDGLNFNGLGKHKLGKGCLYIKRLSDINLKKLEEIIVDSIKIIKKKYT
ncbi:MAG: DUF1801 domain-containing protein [Flavobacteriaceae bacterium]